MTYKPLPLLRKYRVTMNISAWDDRAFHMNHTFYIGDRIVAEGTSRGMVISKNGVIPPETVMQTVSDQRQK